MRVEIVAARPEDAAIVHRFIRELAEYEREPDAVEATPESLAAQMAEPRPPFECLIARRGGEPAGFALFCHNYSTWKGRRGIWLEDLYVTPASRGRGVGRALLARVAGIAVERGCARLEWAVLDWNESAIGFYRELGARPLAEWTMMRVTGPALGALADRVRSEPPA